EGSQNGEGTDDDEAPEISKWEPIVWLSIITAWISFLSEYLVNAIEGASEAWNISLAFITIIFAPNCYQLFLVLSLIRWVVIEFFLLASF
ncbi:hypothetical protein UlMin_004011, partial [Ulmus minor]